jgi:hypothetical protein
MIWGVILPHWRRESERRLENEAGVHPSCSFSGGDAGRRKLESGGSFLIKLIASSGINNASPQSPQQLCVLRDFLKSTVNWPDQRWLLSLAQIFSEIC